MKTKILFFFLIIGIIGCNSTAQRESKPSKNKKDAGVKSIQGKKVSSNKYLFIEGQNIWIRSKPSTGKVVMKLNTGDKCKILEKGKQETIMGVTDFWYKIEFNGKAGWVFGSQTSMKADSDTEFDKKKILTDRVNEFIRAIKEENWNRASSFIHPDYGFFYTYRPGAYDAYNYYHSIYELKDSPGLILRKLKSLKPGTYKFEKLPKFNCDGFDKEGNFISGEFNYTQPSEIVKIQEELLSTKNTKKQNERIRNLESKVKRYVLFTKSAIVGFAVGKIDGNWYLLVLDNCTYDCSA